MSETDEATRATESTPHVSFVPDDKSTSLAVIEAVAAVSGRPPLADGSGTDGAANEPLEPFHEAINPDALNAICSSKDEKEDATTTVTFTYCGYGVTVESTGQITITGN